MPLSLLLLSLGFFLACALLGSFGLWFLLKERTQLRAEMRQTQAAWRAREEELLQQLLRAKGVKPLPGKLEERKEIAPPTLELAEYTDRLKERVEAGLLTPAQARYMIDEASTGAQTQDELDRALWLSPTTTDRGSEI